MEVIPCTVNPSTFTRSLNNVILKLQFSDSVY